MSENQIENFRYYILIIISDLSDLKSLTTLQMRSNLIKNLDFEMPNLPSLFSLNLEYFYL